MRFRDAPFVFSICVIASCIATAAMPAQAASADSNAMGACNVILTTGVELTFVGPQASSGCDATLQLGDGAYPTNRPPDTLGCGFKVGDTAAYVGIAFGKNPSALTEACAQYAARVKPVLTEPIILWPAT